MTEATAETTEVETPESHDNPLSARIRTSLALAQTRLSEVAKGPAEWTARVPRLPAQVQAAVDRAIEGARVKLRDSLDLPSRADITSLVERLEALDHKIAKLESETAEVVEAPRKKKAGGAKKSANGVDKSSRRDAIKASAKSRAKPRSTKSS